MKLIILFLLVITIIFSGKKLFTEDPVYSQRFLPAENTGEIDDLRLEEASGMVASRSIPGLFWVINDSGNDPMLFLIDKNGQIRMNYLIDGCDNIDWEDLAIYTDKATGKSQIYIADIGDNFAFRSHINIILIDEPTVINRNDSILYHAKNYCFTYEDGPHDAETLLVDPITKGIYIITKREENVRIYEAPKILNSSDTMNLVFKQSMPFFNITSGDISQDGTEILLKTYNAIFYWKYSNNESLVDALSKDHELLNYIPEPQGESIAWSVENNGFYTLSERNNPLSQILYFYKRNRQ